MTYNVFGGTLTVKPYSTTAYSNEDYATTPGSSITQ